MNANEVKFLDCLNLECPAAANIDECRRLNRENKCPEEGNGEIVKYETYLEHQNKAIKKALMEETVNE